MYLGVVKTDDVMGKDVTAWASSQNGGLKVVPFHDSWIPPGNGLPKTPKTEAEKVFHRLAVARLPL